jgi:hypothetical protein
MNHREILIDKLEQFIRRYYNSLIIKGGLLTAALSLALFIILSMFEYFPYSDSWDSGLILYGFLAANGCIILLLIVKPVLKKHGLSKRLSYETAARIIGSHFGEISDKLLNALQLSQIAQRQQSQETDLLIASIAEKTAQVRPFRFQSAIDLRKNLKYVKYAALPLTAIAAGMLWNPRIFTDSTQRIVNYGQYYEKPAPYRFVILNDNLTAFQNEDFTLRVRIEGEMIPDEAFIRIGNAHYKLRKESKTEFGYEMKNLQKDVLFQLFTPEVSSPEHQLTVLEKPVLISFSMHLEYPSYTRRPHETIDNMGDVTVAQGTKITWKFNTRNTDQIVFSLPEKTLPIDVENEIASLRLTLTDNLSYRISSKNRYLTGGDSLQYFVTVVPDQYPGIDLTVINDSLFADRFYFKGNLVDDYGLRQLYFVYAVFDKDNKQANKEQISIPISSGATAEEFYYYFDAQLLNLQPGQRVEYYFEVWDNDQINGSKSAKSSLMTFLLPTLEQMQQQTETTNAQTRAELTRLLKNSDKILKDIEALKKKLIQQPQVSWQDKKAMEELLEQLRETKAEIEQITQQQQQQQQINKTYNTQQEDIIRKQEELQKRFDELFSDEMKAMIEQLQQLQQQNVNKDRMNQLLRQMERNTEELNRQLDQSLELFKRLEVENKLENILSKAIQLAEEEQQLSRKTEEKTADIQKLKQDQDAVGEQFKQLQQDLRETEKLNRELENPYPLDKLNNLRQEISNQLQQAEENLEKNQRKQAGQNQQKASEKMQEMAQQLDQLMTEEEQENLGEDIQIMRRILDNIIYASFRQEEIMKQTQTTDVRNPATKQIIADQFHLKDNLGIISDSISAVAKRQTAVEGFINKKVTQIMQSQDQIVQLFNAVQEPTQQQNFNNYKNQIASYQQYMMTSLNDLSLMIAESLKKMQQQHSQGSSSCKKGNKECNNPNGSSGSGKKDGQAKSMRQLQEQLNKQLEEARQKMNGQQEKGKDGNKDGQMPSPSGKQPSMSEQLARMAAQQAAIRKLVQEYQGELKKDGKGYQGELDRLMQEMEQTERDLVNKVINQQTINRQQQILTRLLESERADLQREKDDQRQSRQGVDIAKPVVLPPRIEEQFKKKKDAELYKTVPPTLSGFYKEKVNAYFHRFDSD